MNQQLPMPQFEEVHLQDYLNVIMRRKKTFVLCFLAIVAGVTLYTFLVPPSYESTATLFVKDDKGKVGQMGDLLLNAATPVDSELEILKSRSNAEKVVAALHLDWKVDKLSDGVTYKLLEFSSTAKEPVYSLELAGQGRFTLRDDDGSVVGAGQSGILMRGKGVTLLVRDLKGEKGDSFRLALLPFNETVQNFQKEVKAAEVGKKTNVIAVSYRNRNPELARDVVNELVQAYLDKGVAMKAEEATRTVGFVEEQLKGVKGELEGAEQKLEAYKSATGVVQLDAEAQTLIQTLSDAEKQKAELTLHRKQIEFALSSLKAARIRGVVYSPSLTEDDPVVASLATKLSELEVQKKGLLTDTTEGHPNAKILQGEIDEVQRKLQATYETALKNAAKQETTVSAQIAVYDGQLKKLPVAERDLARLMRVNKVNSDIFTFLLQKHEEARIAKASTINNISIVDPAITADKPVSPKKAKNLLLGIVVGLMGGVGLCFFQEYLDDSLKDPEEAKRHLALPLLAMIPYIPKKEGNQAMISHHAPKSSSSEAFRSLRTALHFSALKKEKQVMLITSSLAGEGKSTVACNLAITFAQTGAKVLIVDCDLRRSTLHEKLGADHGAGLTELLAGDIATAAALHATGIEGLDFLRAGTVPPNPAELLGSETMSEFITEMRAKYDYIIIDAPPVLAVTDAPVLTAVADLVIMVLEAGRVPVKAAKRTREMLQAVAAPVAGIVVSDKKRRADAYGYGYGYGYGSDKEKKEWWRFGRQS
jgi:capsular exopolysaccharide synthesis family protein